MYYFHDSGSLFYCTEEERGSMCTTITSGQLYYRHRYGEFHLISYQVEYVDTPIIISLTII